MKRIKYIDVPFVYVKSNKMTLTDVFGRSLNRLSKRRTWLVWLAVVNLPGLPRYVRAYTVHATSAPTLTVRAVCGLHTFADSTVVSNLSHALFTFRSV